MNQVDKDDLLGACDLIAKEATKFLRSGEADEMYVNGLRYGIRRFRAAVKTTIEHPGKLSAEARSDGRAANGRKPAVAKQTAKKTVTKKPRGTTAADQGQPATPSQRAKANKAAEAAVETMTRGQKAAATRAANRAARESAVLQSTAPAAKKATAKKASASKKAAAGKKTASAPPAKATVTKAAAVTKAPASKSNVIPIDSVRHSGPPIKAVGR